MAKLTQNVMVLSSGLQRSKGQSVGQGEVPPSVWQAWIDEGILINVKAKQEEKPSVDNPIEPAPAPHNGAGLLHEKSGDNDLHKLSEDELRAMGKRMRIRSWHLMKLDTLIQRIEERT